jgi:hypothetical protein
MTGEMSQSEVTAEAFPLHFAIAAALNGEVRAFDVYQGPYILTDHVLPNKLWLSSDDGVAWKVYNDTTDKESEPFLLTYDDEIDNANAVLAAESITTT